MLIYLIRHAHAVKGTEDAGRRLSKKGRGQVIKVAAFLRQGHLLGAREFWHSPLVRSRETAEQLVRRLKVRAKLVEVGGLEPEADPAVLARRLQRWRRSVAVVGHEPHLGALAALLLSGGTRAPFVVFRKCAVLTLERTGERWLLRWQISPEEIS